jgi:hypothetical protein
MQQKNLQHSRKARSESGGILKRSAVLLWSKAKSGDIRRIKKA